MHNFLSAAIMPLLFVISCNSAPREKIPEFEMLLADSVTIIHTSQIPKGRPIVVVQFSADCRECQHETQAIISKLDSLKDVRFYFVTAEDFSRLKVFQKYYHLERYDNIIAGKDTKAALSRHLDDYSTPMMLVYDGNKGLRAVYKGQTDIHQLISMIHEIQN